MSFIRLIEGRRSFALVILSACALALTGLAASAAAEEFPFDQELVLSAKSMRPAKRMPILNVAANGEATIDLWCKTVTGRVEIADTAIKIEPGPLPEALPQMMSDGQCTPARMQADSDMIAALSQVTSWKRQGQTIVLLGPTTLKFRPSDH